MQITQILQEILPVLKKRFGFLETDWCNILIGLALFLNPVAMGFQLVKIWDSTTEQLAGISILTFLLFVVIQASVLASAIKSLDPKLFWSILLTELLTIAIVVVVAVRMYL